MEPKPRPKQVPCMSSYSLPVYTFVRAFLLVNTFWFFDQVYREMTKRGGARSRTAARLLGHTPESSADSSRRKYIRNLASSLFNKGELEFLELYSNSGYPRCDDIFKRGGLVKKVGFCLFGPLLTPPQLPSSIIKKSTGKSDLFFSFCCF